MLLVSLIIVSLTTTHRDVQPVLADTDGHSHFRFGHITWLRQETDPANTARITYIAGFRRSGFICRNPIGGNSLPCSESDGRPGVGDVFLESVGATRINNFGDGASTSTLYFKVFAFSRADDWVMAKALQPGTRQEYIVHTYPGSGPFTIVSASCCRTTVLAPNAHINNPGRAYRVEAVVNFQTTASPISLLPPIVDCRRDSTCLFTLAAVDPDANNPERPSLRVRFALPAEMGGSNLIQPPGAEIVEPEDGIFSYRWDTRGATLGPAGYNTLYSTQVVIEDLDAAGNPVSKSALDFFIRIVEVGNLPDNDLIRIPVRWCGLDGSPSMEDPTLVGSTTTNSVLVRRLVTLNDNIYRDGANISFISGARTGDFPVIEGPSPEPDNTNIGNIPNPLTISVVRFHRAVNKCRLAWRDKDAAVTGMLALNINRFVDDNRTPETSILGLAGLPKRNDLGEQMLNGVASVIDGAYLVVSPDADLPRPLPLAADLNEKWFGHELGHALTLEHVEDGVNLMDSGSVRALTITAEQATRIRTQADRYIPDRQIVAAGAGTQGSTWPDELDDVPAEVAFVDLDTIGMAIDQGQATTHLFASTFGLFPEDITGLNYFFIADLDNNPNTGGTPTDVGVPISVQGVELVSRVQVTVSGGVSQGVPMTWKFQGGQFVPITDPGIQAKVGTLDVIAAFTNQQGGTDSSVIPMGQIIQVILPNAVRGSVSANPRLVVVAENPNPGVLDTVEGIITLAPPTFPTCLSSPASAFLGSSVTVEANNLPPNSPVEVLIGANRVATGSTNSAGRAILIFTVPENIRTGTRVVSVHAIETAVAASCVLQLAAIPIFDSPPTPADRSAFTVNAGQPLAFTVQASDQDSLDVVTLNVIGLPEGATFSTQAPANPANGTFSWVPGPEQVGVYVIIFTATDNAGLSATPLSLVVQVVHDTIPPILNLPPSVTLESTGSDGAIHTYTVTATDNTDPAPVVSCSPISGSAFPLGVTDVICTATDAFGNSSQGSFTVTVVDTTAPTLTLSVTPGTLWPPNHQLVALTISVSASDIVDSAPTIRLVSVTSNEPDNAPGNGDGNTTGDIVIQSNFIVQVRAERAGNGTGRVYTLTYEVSDASGNTSTATATVKVPHDQGP